MKKPELFHRTIKILVDAYFKRTLEHGNCYACAVGNIIAGNMNYGFIESTSMDYHVGSDGNKLTWFPLIKFEDNLIRKISNDGFYLELEGLTPITESQLCSTGYSLEELKLIEKAFERIEKPESISYVNWRNSDQHMLNGLMNVVDTLMEIHEADEIEINEAKELFFM